MRRIMTTPVPDWRRNAPPGVPLSAICPPGAPRKVQRGAAVEVQSDGAPMGRVINPAARNRWRSMMARQYTPEQVEYLLHNALAGDLTSQWDLFDLMEDTWPRLAKCLNEIKRSVVSLDWQIDPWSEEDTPPTPAAKERSSLASYCVWSMRPSSEEFENGFEDTVYDVMDAWGKGLTLLEIDWERRATKAHGEIYAPKGTWWVHPVNYGWSKGQEFIGIREGEQSASTPGWYPSADVLPLPEHKFIVAHRRARTGPPLGSALLRPLAWWWCASNFTASWFLNFAQIFGLPIRWATYDPGRPGLFAKVCDMLENMGSTAWAAFPDGTTLDLKSPTTGATDNPQTAMLDRADKQCDLLILGQTLTSDVQDSGSRALGSVHLSVRDDIIVAAGDWAARIIQDHLVRSIIVLNYGDDAECPQLTARPKEVKDEKANADRDAILISAGISMPKKWFYKRHGIPLPEPGEEVIERQAPQSQMLPQSPISDAPPEELESAKAAAATEPAPSVDDIVTEAVARSTGARKRWLYPINEELRRLASIASNGDLRDEDVLRLVEAGRRRLPEIFVAMDREVLADSITDALGAAALRGAKDSL